MLKAISKRKVNEIEMQAKLHGAEFTRPPETEEDNGENEKISVEKIREATARALERKGHGKR